MNNQSNVAKFNQIQSDIDDQMSKYIEDDFKLKLKHYQTINPFLIKRDVVVETFTKEEKLAFYNAILSNFKAFAQLFPLLHDGTQDVSFLKSFKAEYAEPYKMKVSMELYENEYLENSRLEKTIDLFDDDAETTKITWKNEKGSCLLFDFFENTEDDFEGFDIIYEAYVDQLFFAEIDSE